MALDRERILELLEILKSSSAAELSVTEGDVTVRLARPVPCAEPVLVAVSDPSLAELGGEAPAATADAAPAPEEVTVRARVVGLFYRGKQPGQDPLVKIGDVVEQGQTLGTIEVLRKPTDVTSPVAGVISGVLAEDASGVQYGDALFTIQF